MAEMKWTPFIEFFCGWSRCWSDIVSLKEEAIKRCILDSGSERPI